MESALLQEIRRHPLAMMVSVALHVVLLIILTVSLDHTSAPKLPAQPVVKTVQAVAIDASQVDAELKQLKLAEQRKLQQEQSRKKQLERDVKKARDARLKEEKRIADLKRKQKQQEQKEKARQAKLEKERKLKQEELAKLKKQKQELEQKRQAEQQKLAAIESRRKAEEEAARKKQEAEEAERRRQAEEAELKRRLAEEEQRQDEQNSRLQTLRAQYAKLIERQVARNWLPPAQMTSGWYCEVMVQQNRLGDVTQVQMLKCTGNEAFRNTVERAVKKASPLPPPPSPEVFDQKLQFTFRPEV